MLRSSKNDPWHVTNTTPHKWPEYAEYATQVTQKSRTHYTFLHSLRSNFSPLRPLQLWFEAACEASLARDKYVMQSTQKSRRGRYCFIVPPARPPGDISEHRTYTEHTEVKYGKNLPTVQLLFRNLYRTKNSAQQYSTVHTVQYSTVQYSTREKGTSTVQCSTALLCRRSRQEQRSAQ